MAINDFLAGGADLASGLFDIWGLGSAAVKYPFYKLSGHDNAFADALQNTWGAQIGQGIRDFNSDLFNSEEDAPGRRAGSDVAGFGLDLITGGSGRVLRLAGKAAQKGAYTRARKLATRALLDTAATNTAINMGMSALSGEGLTPTESGIAAMGFVGAPNLIRRGTRYFKSKAKLLENKFAPNAAQQYKNNMSYYDFTDARRGALRQASHEGFQLGDEFSLSPQDRSKLDPLLNEFTEKLKVIDPKNETLAQFNQLDSELQQRLQGLITSIDIDNLLPEATDRIAKTLGVPNNPSVIRESLLNMSKDDLIGLMRNHPELFPETGYLDKLTGQPITNQALLLKYDSLKSKLKAEDLQKNKEFFDLFQKDLQANVEAGIVSEREAAKELHKAKQVGYIPKSSIDERTFSDGGILGVGPNATSNKAASQTGLGVMRQTNSFETAFKIAHSHAAARKLNADIMNLRHQLGKQLPRVLSDAMTQEAYWTKQAKILKGYDKHLAEMNVAYYRDRIKDLKKFEPKFVPETDAKTGEIIMPKDRDLVSYMENGTQKFMTVPKNYMRSLFMYGDKNSNAIIRGIQDTNSFTTQFRTGKWNALNFGFTKMAYGLWEGMPALTSEAAKKGISLPAWRVMFEQARQAKNILSNEYYEWLMNNIQRRGKFLGYTVDDIAELQKKISDPLFSIWTSPYDNFAELKKAGASNLFDVINPDTATTFEYLKNRARKAWNWIDQSAPAEFLRILNVASAESMSAATTKLARELFPDDAVKRREFLMAVANKTSDTRRRGAAISKTGKAVRLASDVMPYGKSTIQGLMGKLDYFEIGKNLDMFSNLVHGSRGIDKLTNLATVLAGKTQGEVFDMLWKFVVMPTAICYFWNNMTPDQSEDYHELTNLARSKNRLLVNFGGRGVHAYFPVDQEWSVLSNMTEALLDSTFSLSDNDPNNPDWSYKDQLLKSAGRALGVEFPVPVNMVTGAIGFTPNVNAETLLGGEDSIIEPIRGEGLSARISYELGEVLGTVGNAISISLSDRPFNADMLGQIPLLTDSWTQQHHNSTSAYVDRIYKQNPQAFPCKDLMTKRKYMESRLRHFKATGLTMDGRPYNMPRQQVIETITHNIQKLNGEMYRQLKEQGLD